MASSGDRNVEELKRLVVHTLETNGVLGQIRAELRSNVYKVIDEDETRTAPTHRPAAKLMNHPNGSLMAEIVAEFFEFYDFRHSLSVFMPESNLGRNERRSRDQLAMDAGLDPRAARLGDASILEQLVGLATGASEIRKGGDSRGDDWHSSASSTTASSPPPTAPAAARLPPSSESSTPVAPKADLEASPRGTPVANTATTSGAVSGHGPTDSVGTSTAGGEEQDEASHTEEGAPEEVSGKHRKPRRKQLLPAISGSKDFLDRANTGGPGQLPPLKASVSPASLSGASERGGPEEVSLSESSIGVSRDSAEEVRDEVLRLDRRLARIPGRPGPGTTTGLGLTGATPAVASAINHRDGADPVTAAASTATNARDANSSIASESAEKAPEVSANDMSNVSVESQVSNAPGAGRSMPTRSAGSSPANSSFVAESPLRSPPLSPGSQQASSASPHGATPNGSFSPGASPKSGSAALSAVDSVPEEAAANQNESISIDESSGDGDLDLALGATTRSTIAPTTASTGASRETGSTITPLSSKAPLSSTAATLHADKSLEEVDEDIDMEEDSHESYQSSEAALSTGARSKSDDAAF